MKKPECLHESWKTKLVTKQMNVDSFVRGTIYGNGRNMMNRIQFDSWIEDIGCEDSQLLTILQDKCGMYVKNLDIPTLLSGNRPDSHRIAVQ